MSLNKKNFTGVVEGTRRLTSMLFIRKLKVMVLYPFSLVALLTAEIGKF
jgi:hypothetical protein